MTNTLIYTGDYITTLQARLKHPQNWKEWTMVLYTDSRTTTTGSITTAPTVTTVTRETAMNPTAIGFTADTLTISTGRDVGVFVDFADLYQIGYNAQMEIAEESADLLNEYIESAKMGRYTAFVDVGDSSGAITSGVSTAITVSAGNIDDIIRGVKRILRVANGARYMKSNGVFIVWRPADFELLEAYAMANGFSEADLALKNGLEEGIHYMGVDHYYSNDYTTGHLVAGVKKIEITGILRSMYGRAFTQDLPAGSSGGVLSGTLFYTRVDIGSLLPTQWDDLMLDINVA